MATVENIIYLFFIIHAYCFVSGQAINFHKSQVTFSPKILVVLKSQLRSLLLMKEKRGG